jgi:hypothetical protein
MRVAERIEPAEMQENKPGLRRKLKKRIKRIGKRLRRSLIWASRTAVVLMVLQLAKRSPKLFVKIRKDVRRHIGGGDEQAATRSAAAISPQVLEDAILTLALHDDKFVSEARALLMNRE